MYDRPKLLMQVSSTEPDFAFDNELHYILQHGGRGGGTDGIVFQSVADDHLMLALLNSKCIDFYLKHISVVFSGKAYSYSDAFIKQLPIKLPLTAVEQQQAKAIAVLAEKLPQTKGALRAKQRERVSFPAPQTQALPASYSFYRLEQLVHVWQLPKTFRRAEVDFSQPTLEGKPTARIGRGRIELPHQAMAEVIVAWLRVQPRETLRTEDLLDIRVPSNEHGCSAILTALAQLEGEIAGLQAQLDSGEARLDDLVADYYGLNAHDRAVIAEFLARF